MPPDECMLLVLKKNILLVRRKNILLVLEKNIFKNLEAETLPLVDGERDRFSVDNYRYW